VAVDSQTGGGRGGLLIPGDGRHLAIPFLLGHIATGLTTVYPFPGRPTVDLVIEGAAPRLTLRAAHTGAVDMPPNFLRNVHVRSTSVAGHRQISVAIEGTELMLDGHAMLCAIADRIQLDGMDPMVAVTETLKRWRDVLAARGRLSPEAEIGLIGELLVLEALCAATDATALLAWRGALHEEHDFGLRELDLEVKTTSTERRQHWITSLTQLQPTQSRSLGLVSLQITRGGKAGRTLPEIVDAIGQSVDTSTFDAKLAKVGWESSTSDLFPDSWLLRNRPKFFMVAEAFPALTHGLLTSANPALTAVTEVQYRIDLSERQTDAIPDPSASAALNLLAGQRDRT
jgi:hypothetical protein